MTRYIRNILSLLLNILVVCLVIYVLKIYLAGGDGYAVRGPSCFAYYTTDSNVIYAISCLIMIPFNVITIIKKEHKIPKWVSIMRLYTTTTVAVTFFVVVLLLGPFNPDGFNALFKGMPYYLHLPIPVIAMVSFICFDLYNEIDKKHIYFNTIPTIFYAFFYFIWVLALNNKDHYKFFQFGPWATIGIVFGISLICFGSGVLLRYLNKLRNNEGISLRRGKEKKK